MSHRAGVALLGLILAGCASPAPFVYYCVEVTLQKGDRSVPALECIPRAEKIPWRPNAPPGRELFR